MATFNEALHFEFVVSQGDFSVAGNASSEVKKILRHIGIDTAIVRRAAIATYEAELNIVIHSFGGKIILDITPRQIEIVCQDKGPGILDIEAAMQEGFSTASDKIREMGFGAGMGLPNMKRCSDIFRIESTVEKGTRVQMIIYLS